MQNVIQLPAKRRNKKGTSEAQTLGGNIDEVIFRALKFQMTKELKGIRRNRYDPGR